MDDVDDEDRSQDERRRNSRDSTRITSDEK
jgi:hypothetical protein